MNKIDRRRTYVIVLDTETAPMDKTFDGVEPSNMLVYDIGWTVADKHGNIYERRSFLNTEVFIYEKELMNSAYYADKIPNYWNEYHNGNIKFAKFYTIRKHLLEDIETYGITEVYAHNMIFDYGSLNNTQRWLTKSKYRYYFPKDIEICDTLKMALQVVAKTPTYKKFCADNGLLTKNNQVRTTAEALYRYITNDINFEESHTALADAEIETQIMAYCYGKHKKMEKRLWAN